MCIPEYLRRADVSTSEKTAADAFEALLGALYFDKSLEFVELVLNEVMLADADSRVQHSEHWSPTRAVLESFAVGPNPIRIKFAVSLIQTHLVPRLVTNLNELRCSGYRQHPTEVHVAV
jgi:hypothetical protein